MVVEPAPSPPARPPLADRLLALAEVLFCSGFPTQLMIIGVMQSAGMRPLLPDGRLHPPFVVTLALTDSVLIVALVVTFLALRGESVSQVLVGRRRIAQEAIVGLALIPLAFGLVIFIMSILQAVAPWLHNVPRNPFDDMLRTRHGMLTFGAVVIIAGGVREEIQRAFILHRFDQFLGGAAVGIVLFSVLFGLGHFDQGQDAMIATASLGAFWGIVYVIRRSVVGPMVSHAGFNLAEILRHLAVGS